MGDIIEVMRITDVTVQFAENGNKTLVERQRIVRKQRLEDFEISYNGEGQKVLVAR